MYHEVRKNGWVLVFKDNIQASGYNIKYLTTECNYWTKYIFRLLKLYLIFLVKRHILCFRAQQCSSEDLDLGERLCQSTEGKVCSFSSCPISWDQGFAAVLCFNVWPWECAVFCAFLTFYFNGLWVIDCAGLFQFALFFLFHTFTLSAVTFEAQESLAFKSFCGIC